MSRPTFHRSYALDSIEIRRGGDGRTVEAYAAVFDQPTEVRDQHGHYNEIIHRNAFNRTLNSGRPPLVLYNHGFNLDGKPDSLAQVPIGSALEVRADERGLFTVTRYNKSDLADSVLEAIRAGDIKAQSFRGGVYRSDPNGRVPRSRDGVLPTVTRTELGLSDYGPTPVPYYQGALITAVRSMTDLASELTGLDDEDRADLIRALEAASPGSGTAAVSASATLAHGSEDTPVTGLSGRDMAAVRRKVRTARILGGI